ncbi:ribosomal prt L34 [Nucleospora cyclopteri]
MQPTLIHRGNTYKTKSNRRVKQVKAGNKILNKKVGKKGKIHRCHGCNLKLTSIAAMRTAEFSRQKVSSRRVSRPFGATHCSNCVAKKITKAFFAEETSKLTK